MVTMKRKISDLKVAELRAELEKRGLESKGLKGVLVQRLQKAIEDEGGNSSEVEFSGQEVSSPKTSGRRSTQRGKRTTAETGEVDSEPSQEEEKEGTPKPETDEAASVLEREKEEEPSTNDDGGDQIDAVADEKIESATDEQSENNDVPENGVHEEDGVSDNEPVSESEVADDATPTRDEEGDSLSPSEYHEPHDDGEGENDQGDEDVTEETFVSADSTMEGEDPAGNDYREDEDETEYQVEEEEAELHDEDDDTYEEGGDESEMVTLEEAHDGEGAEGESDAGPTAVEEEIEQTAEEEEKSQEIEPETKIQSEPIEEEQQQEEDISVDAVIKPETENMETETTAEITTEQKPKPEAGVKDEVSAEVDYLDMLDYDLEPPGEHSTISTPSEEQSGKSDLVTDDKSIEKGHEKNDNIEEKPATTTEDRKSRPNSDSSKPSNSDQSKSGGQSSSKSGNTAGKDGSKTSSSGKRDGSGSSAASKKDDNPNKNLWISGLSSTTRASELKSAFSRYGKVIGAKVVTNVKSPGSRCYGYVTMASADAASKCILHLNNTEMHGRMITVEIAKGDPSASSRKQAASGGSAKKDSDSKDASKSKDSDSKPGSTSSRRSSAAQASSKDGTAADGKDQAEGDKKSQQDSKSREGGQAARRNTTDEARKGGKSKSPARDRSRAERNSTSGPRSGDKRHQGRPGRSEPDRKRPRPQDAADRKVVMDSNKGELRVNVSRSAGGPNRTARWQGEPKPRPLLSRRRSGSPVRRRSFSPMRGSGLSRTGGARGGRGGRGGKAGLITRQGATYEDRNAARARGPHGQILSFSEIRAQQRKGAGRGGRGGGLSRGDLAADRERLRRERDEREKLRIERERLERERRQLEKDRQERERLEQERIRLEQERKRELERIEREKAEMRRLQEITRYEVEQRQRAIKRTYDNDSGSHRSGRTGGPSGRDRPDARSDTRRGGDDRRYVNHGRGGPTRNGPANEPPPPGTTEYRSRQGGSYRGSGSSGPDNRGKPGAGFDNRRGAQDSRHGSDSRYTGGSAGGRTVEKYVRRGGEPAGRGAEFSQSHGFGRNAEQTGQRRSGPQAARDGRKVVRDRPAEHRSGTSPEYRRTGGRGSAGGRVEITREQSPPARRPRRDASPPSGRGGPPSSSRSGGSWRDSGKGGRDTSTRRGGPEDRDLREQIRGRQESYSESSRDRGNSRREGRGNRSPSPSRSSGQFQGGWPETAGGTGSAQQIYPVGADASAIPTQTGRGASNAAWGHVQQWQQSAAGARAWAGAAIPTAPSTVNRQIIPPYGAVPTALIAPPGAMITATQGYGSDRQSRSFQNSYNQKPIQRRF